jgi:hypothetical protein
MHVYESAPGTQVQGENFTTQKQKLIVVKKIAPSFGREAFKTDR